jgi:uncharacterized protein DUF6894
MAQPLLTAIRVDASNNGRERELPQYLFVIRWSDHEEDDERGTALEDDAAALDYACRMVRELRASGGYDDPGLVLNVRNEMREIVLSVPFLAACA